MIKTKQNQETKTKTTKKRTPHKKPKPVGLQTVDAYSRKRPWPYIKSEWIYICML